jgi:hypothetical protein
MMNKQILTLLGAGLIGLMHPGAAQSTLLDFTFVFGSPETVEITGEVFGLVLGATSSASNVIVTSYPALNVPLPPQAVFSEIENNTFAVNVSGGVIQAIFFGVNSAGDIALDIDTPNQFSDLVTNSDNWFGNIPVFTVVVPPSPMAIPELSSVTLTAAGLALLWPLRRQRRRRAAPA